MSEKKTDEKPEKIAENYDSNGNFIPKKLLQEEKYTDYYGPIIQDAQGDKAGKYFIKEYKGFGHYQFFGEIVVLLLFAAFLGLAAYNVYYIWLELQGQYVQFATENAVTIELVQQFAAPYRDQAEAYTIQFGIYLLIGLGIILAIFLFSLGISFLIVRLFSKVVSFLMYASVLFQIGLMAYLYTQISWTFELYGYTLNANYLFLVFILIDVLLLTVWNGKLKKAIRAIKMGSLAVAKQGWQLLTPQIAQSFFIGVICFGFTAISIGTLYHLTPLKDFVYIFTVSTYTITINEYWIYVIAACLFVFSAYLVYYVSQGMKIQMIHYWYRGGGSMGFFSSYNMVRKRWWGLLGYAFSSTLIHMIQSLRKAFKGEFGPKNLKEAFDLTGELLPGKELSFRAKKGTPWYERVWMGLNTFTLPAIMIENKLFHTGILRSLYLMLRDIAQIYIKETHIKRVLFILQYSLTLINTMIGGIAGYFLANYMELTGNTNYIFAAVGSAIFFYIGGVTTTLILDDINLAYVTVLFILSVDELNKKDGYAIDRIESIDGQPQLVIDQRKRDGQTKKGKKAQKSKEKKEKSKSKEPTPEEKSEDKKPTKDDKKKK